MDILLEIQNLNLERGSRQLISNLNLQVKEGEVWHLVGRNGSGKTSCLKAFCGLLTTGVGGNILRFAPMIFQGHLPGIKSSLSVRNNLQAHPAGSSFPDEKDLQSALLAVGLKDFGEYPVGHLSAGQQRRVALARLWFSRSPALWLLDEPFTGLDIDFVNSLEGRIEKHTAEGGAVILSSHQSLRLKLPVQSLCIEDFTD